MWQLIVKWSICSWSRMDELNTWSEGPSANRSIDSSDQSVKTNFLIFTGSIPAFIHFKGIKGFEQMWKACFAYFARTQKYFKLYFAFIHSKQPFWFELSWLHFNREVSILWTLKSPLCILDTLFEPLSRCQCFKKRPQRCLDARRRRIAPTRP